MNYDIFEYEIFVKKEMGIFISEKKTQKNIISALKKFQSHRRINLL